MEMFDNGSQEDLVSWMMFDYCSQDDDDCNDEPEVEIRDEDLTVNVEDVETPLYEDPIVCNDETIDDQENSQSSDTDNIDDSSIPDVDICSHNDEDCNHGVSSGSGGVGGHGCAGPSGFATFNSVSFQEDSIFFRGTPQFTEVSIGTGS
ncbi:hypothetical protein Ddye_008396 [Dipteronia dyeriana]|uniref:Uncharacterized protein n=1 Tax=Dipteronia dyeriana TaxID=168575 RepID=A0AAE0CLB5_9ROSI|nr:hypothetical protein Ddye_008396 [Dipteronia dyeriana]